MSDSKALQTEKLRQHGYKLKLGEFHRYTGDQPVKKRNKKYVSTKKKIRDLERFINREGVPQEIVDAKKKDIFELKQKVRYKKEALRNFTKYKQIRFHERKKCLRRRKKAEKEIEKIKKRIIGVDETIEQFEAKKEEDIKEQQVIIDQCDDDLIYINEFPIQHKYISLYTTNEMPEEILQKREKLRETIFKQRHAREQFRKREMKITDKDGNNEENEVEPAKQVKKNVEPVDTFFVEEDQEVEPDEFQRIVDKTGKVIKIENPNKGYKRQKVSESDHGSRPRQNNRFDRSNNRGGRFASKGKSFNDTKPKKEAKAQPIKIKARTYRVSAANLATGNKKQHIKF